MEIVDRPSEDVLVVREEPGQVEARIAELADLVRKYPRVVRALLGAFIEEGRRYASTPAGARERQHLLESHGIQQITAVWRSLGLDQLEPAPVSLRPSDIVAALVAIGEMEQGP